MITIKAKHKTSLKIRLRSCGSMLLSLICRKSETMGLKVVRLPLFIDSRFAMQQPDDGFGGVGRGICGAEGGAHGGVAFELGFARRRVWLQEWCESLDRVGCGAVVEE